MSDSLQSTYRLDASEPLELHMRALAEAQQRSEDRVRAIAGNSCISDWAHLFSSMPGMPNCNSAEVDTRAAQAARDASAAIQDVCGVPARGYYIPLFGTAARDLGTGVFANGGALAGGRHSGDLLAALRPHSLVVAAGARIVTGIRASSSLILLKLSKGGGAAWVGEFDSPPQSDPEFDQVVVQPHLLRASITVSNKLLKQASIRESLTTVLEHDLLAAMMAAVDGAAIAGTGTSDQPLGVINHAGVAIVAAGTNGDVPDWGLVTDIEYEADSRNAPGASRWVMNAATRRKLRKTPRAAGQDFIIGDSNTLLGKEFGVSESVPSTLTKGTGSNLSAILYGDLSTVLIGIWGAAAMDVVLDPYTLAKEARVRLHAFMHVGIGHRYPEGFAVCRDVVTAD